MHNLGPSQMEQSGMYHEQTFEAPYQSENGESPLHEILAQEAPLHEMYESPMQETEYHEAQYHEAPYNEAPYHEAQYHEAPYHEAQYHEAPYQETGFNAGEAAFQEMYGESPMLGEYMGEEEVISEEEEMALAAELLEIQSEEELDRFLGKLIKRVARGASSFIRSPVGKMIGGVLRQVAKRALPIAGKALGTFIGGPVGGLAAGHLTTLATQAMGLEAEGMSQQEAEFATARQFIRFGNAATRRAMRTYSTTPRLYPNTIVQSAFRSAAQQYAPGLLGPSAGRIAALPIPTGRRRGVWIRRGRTLTLYGV
jgi:hypothetical protein